MKIKSLLISYPTIFLLNESMYIQTGSVKLMGADKDITGRIQGHL